MCLDRKLCPTGCITACRYTFGREEQGLIRSHPMGETHAFRFLTGPSVVVNDTAVDVQWMDANESELIRYRGFS